MNTQDMFVLKRAQLDDVPVIREIAHKAFPDTFGGILSPEQLEWMLDWMYSERVLTADIGSGHQEFYLGYWEGVPCGYISITAPSEEAHAKEADANASAADLEVVQASDLPIYKLNKIYLSPDFQGLGLGRRLWQEAVEIIKGMEKGPCRMILQVNRDNDACAFYEHLGMTCIAEEDFVLEHGYEMNDYVMAIDV